jgi:AcrR family transcriptional regulator
VAFNLIEKSENKQRVSMRQIATATGVSAPTLYYYFENKREIMNALFEQVAGDGPIFCMFDLEEYFKQHPALFNAMFNDGENNVNVESITWENSKGEVVQRYPMTPDILGEFDQMIGRLTRILAGLK